MSVCLRCWEEASRRHLLNGEGKSVLDVYGRLLDAAWCSARGGEMGRTGALTHSLGVQSAGAGPPAGYDDAVDEIDRLRARIEALEEALRSSAHRFEAHAQRIEDKGVMAGCPSVGMLRDEALRARTLLSTTKPDHG